MLPATLRRKAVSKVSCGHPSNIRKAQAVTHGRVSVSDSQAGL